MRSGTPKPSVARKSRDIVQWEGYCSRELIEAERRHSLFCIVGLLLEIPHIIQRVFIIIHDWMIMGFLLDTGQRQADREKYTHRMEEETAENRTDTIYPGGKLRMDISFLFLSIICEMTTVIIPVQTWHSHVTVFQF